MPHHTASEANCGSGGTIVRRGEGDAFGRGVGRRSHHYWSRGGAWQDRGRCVIGRFSLAGASLFLALLWVFIFGGGFGRRFETGLASGVFFVLLAGFLNCQRLKDPVPFRLCCGVVMGRLL